MCRTQKCFWESTKEILVQRPQSRPPLSPSSFLLFNPSISLPLALLLNRVIELSSLFSSFDLQVKS
jgi:hypothetical protein